MSYYSDIADRVDSLVTSDQLYPLHKIVPAGVRTSVLQRFAAHVGMQRAKHYLSQYGEERLFDAIHSAASELQPIWTEPKPGKLQTTVLPLAVLLLLGLAIGGIVWRLFGLEYAGLAVVLAALVVPRVINALPRRLSPLPQQNPRYWDGYNYNSYCPVCGRSASLHMKGGEFPPDQGLTRCQSCNIEFSFPIR